MNQIQRSHNKSYIVEAIYFEHRHLSTFQWMPMSGYYISYQADLMELAS